MASAAPGISSLRTMFECAVCLEKFKDPRILTACGHQFCMSCIEGITGSARRKNIMCPTCRAVTKIKAGAKLTELPRPILMNQVQEMVMETLDSRSAMQSCGPCNRKMMVAQHYCYECRECFCITCFTKHSNAPAFQGHSTDDLHRVVFCPDHRTMPLTLYCLPCNTVICSTCTIGDHENHPAERMNTAAESERSKLKVQLRLKEDILKQCENALENARLSRKETMEKSMVNKMHYGKVRELLMHLQIELQLNEANSSTVSSSNLNKVESYLHMLKDNYIQIKQYCEASNGALDEVSDVQFLTALKKLPEIKTEEVPRTPCLARDSSISGKSGQLLTELSTLVHYFPTMPKATVVPGLVLDGSISASQRPTDDKSFGGMTDACFFMRVTVFVEEDFVGHQGFDLFDKQATNFLKYDVRKTSTMDEFTQVVKSSLGIQSEVRFWIMTLRTNGTQRPLYCDSFHTFVVDITVDDHPLLLYLETANPAFGQRSLQTFNRESDVLLFFKHYEPKRKSMYYCGHVIMPICESIGAFLVPMMCAWARCPLGTQFLIFKEVKPNMIERVKDISQPIEAKLDDLMDGDIIVFQEDDQETRQHECPTAIEYFRALYLVTQGVRPNQAGPSQQGQ